MNGLEYGHQAIVANNKKLTLSTVVRGLDFTMDSRHEDILEVIDAILDKDAYFAADEVVQEFADGWLYQFL